MSRGISFDDMPLDRFANYIYWWCTHNAEEKDKEKFDRQLWLPPAGEKAEGVWSAENETAAFAALANSLSGGGQIDTKKPAN